MPPRKDPPNSPVPPQSLARAALLDHLPKEMILARYELAGGKEISSGKFANPESSAALAANAFGLFLEVPGLLSLPGMPLSASHVTLEAEMRFPWNRGRHPWLDAAVETPTHLIGIESKRYEPFRDSKAAHFSDAYFQPVWGDAMQGFERMRDALAEGDIRFVTLDAAQLVKHAFGLRTQALARGKRAVLIYLYAEPKAYPDGRGLAPDLVARHRSEVEAFSAAVTDPSCDVGFVAFSYAILLAEWARHGDQAVRSHSVRMRERFDI